MNLHFVRSAFALPLALALPAAAADAPTLSTPVPITVQLGGQTFVGDSTTVILYKLVSGRLPFKADGFAEFGPDWRSQVARIADDRDLEVRVAGVLPHGRRDLQEVPAPEDGELAAL